MWGHFITGDFGGLNNLAGDLYDFASKCSSEVRTLSGRVDQLIADDHDQWVGETASMFKASYGQDAVMMNGTNRVIAGIAAVIDKLALRLAKLEYQVEQKVDIAVNAGYVSVSPDGDATEVTCVPGKPAAVYNALDSLITKARIQAQKIRMQADAELVVLTAELSSGLNYYSGASGQPGSLDPNGLLSKAQQTDDAKAVKRLQAELKDEASKPNFKQNLADLTKLRGQQKQIGEIIGDIKGGKNPIDVLTKLGPVVEELGGEIGIIAIAG